MRITLATVLAVLLLLAESVWAQGDKPSLKQPESNKKEGSSVWMKIKLKSTENILRGLTLGDFILIEENARRMNNFGRLEKLVHSRNAEYQTQLKFFEHANRELIRQAKKQNLDGSTLAFMQLTTSCINCHRTIRDHKHRVERSEPTWTHILKRDTAFYSTGPQQGQPADGQLGKGEKVRRIKDAGSYCQVRTEDGRAVYVASDALNLAKKKTHN